MWNWRMISRMICLVNGIENHIEDGSSLDFYIIFHIDVYIGGDWFGEEKEKTVPVGD